MQIVDITGLFEQRSPLITVSASMRAAFVVSGESIRLSRSCGLLEELRAEECLTV